MTPTEKALPDARRDRRERVATAVYAAMRPGVREGTFGADAGARHMHFATMARLAVEAADALVAALETHADPQVLQVPRAPVKKALVALPLVAHKLCRPPAGDVRMVERLNDNGTWTPDDGKPARAFLWTGLEAFHTLSGELYDSHSGGSVACSCAWDPPICICPGGLARTELVRRWGGGSWMALPECDCPDGGSR